MLFNNVGQMNTWDYQPPKAAADAAHSKAEMVEERARHAQSVSPELYPEIRSSPSPKKDLQQPKLSVIPESATVKKI